MSKQNGTHTGQDKAPTKTLIVIGGHEDKSGRMSILREVARRVGQGKLVVTTVASHQPEGYYSDYQEAFGRIGFDNLAELEIMTRAEASQDQKVRILDNVNGLFFTGGDQLKITSQIGDSPILRRIMEIYNAGGVIAGTSAGASVLCETMLVRGTGRESFRLGDLDMAPGLGLIRDAIVDQHFAERGRMGRLLGAVAQNPRVLGIGIDEDTAIVVENGEAFTVLGSGAVTIVDGQSVSYSNITEERDDKTLSIFDIKMHVLSDGDQFDLITRRPGELSQLEAAEIQTEEAEAAEAQIAEAQ